MEYKEIIKKCFPEVWPNQYLICKNFDMELIYYADDDEFLYWENLYCEDVTEKMKKYLNKGSEIMEYVEMLTRSEIYLQKISAEMTNNGGDKESIKTLKRAMEIIENLMKEER